MLYLKLCIFKKNSFIQIYFFTVSTKNVLQQKTNSSTYFKNVNHGYMQLCFLNLIKLSYIVTGLLQILFSKIHLNIKYLMNSKQHRV